MLSIQQRVTDSPNREFVDFARWLGVRDSLILPNLQFRAKECESHPMQIAAGALQSQMHWDGVAESIRDKCSKDLTEHSEE